MLTLNNGVTTIGRICCGCGETVKFYSLEDGTLTELQVEPYIENNSMQFYEVPNESVAVVTERDKVVITEKFDFQSHITFLDKNTDLDKVILNDQFREVLKTEYIK